MRMNTGSLAFIIISSAASLTVGFLFYFYNGDYENNKIIILKCFLFLLFAVLQTELLLLFLKRFSAALLVSLFIAAALSFIPNSFRIILLALIMFCIYYLKRSVFYKTKNIMILGFSFLTGIIFGLAVWEGTSENVTDPFSAMKIEQLTLNPDTLFHASLAEMIKSFGTVSTGLHGLPKVHYHILSHFFFACLSKILKTQVYEVYGFAQYLVMGPFLVYSYFRLADGFLKVQAGGIRFLLFSGIVIFSSVFSRNFGQSIPNITSESYFLSVILFAGFLHSVYFPYRKLYLENFICSVYLFLMTLAKISVGSLGAAVFCIHIILSKRLNVFEKTVQLIFALAAWIAGYSLARTTDIPGLEVKFSWMFYQKALYPSLTIPQFIFSHFIYYWLFLGIFAARILFGGLQRKDITEFLSFSAIFSVGLLALNITIDSSGYYFSNVLYFYFIGYFLYEIRILSRLSAYSKLNIHQTAVLIVFGYCTLSSVNFFTGKFLFSIDKTLQIRNEVLANRFYENRYVNHLKKIREDKQMDFMVYIPKKETGFWDNLDDKYSPWSSPGQQCIKMPFIIPLISGLPAVYGLPKNTPEKNCFIFFRGYESYMQNDYMYSERDEISGTEICSQVLRFKFKGYYKVQYTGYEKIYCRAKD